jgi:hypothetical protein
MRIELGILRLYERFNPHEHLIYFGGGRPNHCLIVL